VKEAAKASEFRVCMELSERAESTLCEELAEGRPNGSVRTCARNWLGS
jgi:hypothetical protein